MTFIERTDEFISTMGPLADMLDLERVIGEEAAKEHRMKYGDIHIVAGSSIWGWVWGDYLCPATLCKGAIFWNTPRGLVFVRDDVLSIEK
jgi:hypothetical protein